LTLYAKGPVRDSGRGTFFIFFGASAATAPDAVSKHPIAASASTAGQNLFRTFPPLPVDAGHFLTRCGSRQFRSCARRPQSMDNDTGTRVVRSFPDALRTQLQARYDRPEARMRRA
jgi:hypothetical protein